MTALVENWASFVRHARRPSGSEAAPNDETHGTTTENDDEGCDFTSTRPNFATTRTWPETASIIVAAYVAFMASSTQAPSGASSGSGRSSGESAGSDLTDSGALAMELDALGISGERAVAFAKGRAAGLEAARRQGPVPDNVADAIAAMITGDPAVRSAG